MPGRAARETAVEKYGMQIHRYGVVYHSDRRRRGAAEEIVEAPKRRGRGLKRGMIRALSKACQRRLEYVAANAGVAFKSLLTLTYHAPGESWGDEERNGLVAKRSKADLNRFLSCLRAELGAYVWVQEFQARGAVHFHVLCEREVAEERVRVAWCRATGELDDGAALRHAAKVEAIRGERGARSYVGRYLGKGRQKELPAGVERAGRWWGRSRSMTLAVLAEVESASWHGQETDVIGVRVVRGLRAYLSKRLGWKFRGGRWTGTGS